MAIETQEAIGHELHVLENAVNPNSVRTCDPSQVQTIAAAAFVQHYDAERIAVALENIAESLSNIVMNGVTTTKGF